MTANPPAYSDIPAEHQGTPSISPPTSTPQITTSRISGNVVTCSIRDGQVDYLKIVRDSRSRFHICLIVDPTPIYCIRLASEKNTSIAGDVQIFPANNTGTSAIAGARLLIPSKNWEDPVAMICTSEPSNATAVWTPVSQVKVKDPNVCFSTSIPIVKVPGIAPKNHQFEWWAKTSEPLFELKWDDGPLPLVPADG